MITAKKKKLIRDSLQSLAATNAEAVAQIEKTINILSAALELDNVVSENTPPVASSSTGPQRKMPIADRNTLSVLWCDKTCFLGNTPLFWFFDRLARTPDQYVSHVDLLDEVWGGERQSTTIRGVAKRLRDKLSEAGMDEVARSIDGGVSGYYGLILV